jgi:DNA-binding SARP family transcriptional activator
LLRKADVTTAAPAGTESREEAAVQPLLRVYGFGESRILRGDTLIANADWGMAKSRELVYYLLSHRQTRKEQIGHDLWPELSPARLRASFHVTLYRVRRALDQQDCIKYEDETYFFNRQTNYWFDVEEFEKAFRKGSSVWATDHAKAARFYESAAILYGGDFLQDLSPTGDWCLLKKEELQQKFLTALQRLGDHHVQQGNHNLAIRFYERVLDKDNYQEAAYRGIMECQASLGNRSTALKTYHRLAKLLEEELETSPSSETTAVYENVLRGKAGSL